MIDLQARRVRQNRGMTRVWCNGRWIDSLDFGIAPTDRGLMHGLGLFETILGVDGRPVFAGLHLERLRHGCERLGWAVELGGLEEIMVQLIAGNHLRDGRCRVRVAVTGGSGVLGDLRLGEDHLLWVTATLVAEPPAALPVNLAPFPRNERSPLAGFKCSSYAENLIALDQAARLGFEETLFLNTAGHVCEAATSNVFLVKNGEVLTPSLACGCLRGIIRGVVIHLAGELGIACRQTELSVDDLHAADEIFITSSIRGVMGVSRFGTRLMPPGPVTAKLRAALDKAIHASLR
jgi:branched-subunit amino acid aminotransferase/4-amino-4-deoxychorismate lyase